VSENSGLCINSIKKYKEPLLITEDGFEIFNGDYTCLVNKKIFTTCIYSAQYEKPASPDYLVFKHTNNASNWIEENKPQYSKKDMIEFANYCGVHINNASGMINAYSNCIKK